MLFKIYDGSCLYFGLNEMRDELEMEFCCGFWLARLGEYLVFHEMRSSNL
jgi:hypothetical protein